MTDTNRESCPLGDTCPFHETVAAADANGIKYEAEKAMTPILQRWFAIDLDPVDAERNAENAAVDLSWHLEHVGLLNRPLADPAPEPAESWSCPGCGAVWGKRTDGGPGPLAGFIPAPVGLTEAEVLHMTDLREAWRRAAPVYTDLAATDVEWLCTLIDRLSSPPVDPEEEP